MSFKYIYVFKFYDISIIFLSAQKRRLQNEYCNSGKTGRSGAKCRQFVNEAVDKVKMPTPMRLRDLIRQIRAARTAAEERAVVNKGRKISEANFSCLQFCQNERKNLHPNLT